MDVLDSCPRRQAAGLGGGAVLGVKAAERPIYLSVEYWK
jgi:hypothetical protein